MCGVLILKLLVYITPSSLAHHISVPHSAFWVFLSWFLLWLHKVYIAIRSNIKDSFSPNPHQHWLPLVFLITAIWIEVGWNSKAVLICIVLMAKDALKTFSMIFLLICIFANAKSIQIVNKLANWKKGLKMNYDWLYLSPKEKLSNAVVGRDE